MLNVSSHTHMIASLGSALGLLLPWELSCPLPESLLMAHWRKVSLCPSYRRGKRPDYGGWDPDEIQTQAVARFLVLSSFS